ncbi:MAG: restriction endonuclease subunit S [Enterococcus hirae]|nr:restriction endonuclease subunit S [Enterococcus hirae]
MSKKSPQLRFEGFTDDWEERKLSNVVSLLGGNAFKSKDSVTEEGVRWLKIANVSNSGIKWNEESFLPSDYWERYPNYRIVAGDYVMALTRPIIAHELKIAKMPLGSNALLNQRVAKLIWNMNADFGFQLLRKRNVVDYIEQTISGTDPPNLSGNTFEKIMVSVPKTVEQEKIGRFLETVDNLLAVNQRKLDLLKEQKKGYLQKMFPKNGVKVPELRFAGFADDWEERKLKDVLDISKTKNKAQQYGKVDVLSVSREVGTVNQIKYQGRSLAGSDLSNYKVVQGGELIYTKSPLKGAPYGIFQVATIKGILSPLYAVYTSTDKAYTPFVAMALKNDNIATHYLTPLVTKGAKNTINVTDEGALEGKIQFPSILEQKQIFIFFKQLDDTIALHQRKLDLLKEQKKGILQKMFV